MAQAQSPTTFRWEQHERFRREVARLQAEGQIPTDISQSEVIRSVLEEWLAEPDPDVVRK